MKRVSVLVACTSLFSLLLILFLPSRSLAQIPNAGFESWADDGGGNINPVGWETTNSSPFVTVDSVAPGHSGSYAMRVRTVNVGVVFPGAAILQTPISLADQPAKFGAWIKSTIMSGDTALVLIGLLKGDTVVAATDSCTFKISTSYASYTYLEFPIRYLSTKIPDSLYIMVATGLFGGNATVGTEIIVDDLVFISGLTDVAREEAIPGEFMLHQNYPNPFNPETKISYELRGKSEVKISVVDLLGREVATLVNESLPAGYYGVVWNASRLPSGTYFVRMNAGRFVQTRKMVLVR